MSASARLWFTVLLFSAAPGLLAGEDSQKLVQTLESRIPQIMKDQHVPGLSMVLIRDNRIVWTKAFGVRVADETEKVDEQTIFEAASMSKPVFSYAVLKLAEEGSFDLDRPLDAYLAEPYLPDEAAADKINGRMVMLHRTGLPNWREGGWRSGTPLHLQHEPGSQFTYSGEGFLYLQTAIERITQQPVEKWMKARLLTPLGMDRSSYRWQECFETNCAGGHDRNGNVKNGRRFYERGNTAYSLYTTPTDYARFLIEIVKRDRSAAHSLQSETIDKMTTLQVEPEEDNPRSCRSLGWTVDSPDNGGHVCHTGTNGAGFHCVARFNVGRRSGCVIMTNNVGAREACETILDVIDEVAPTCVSTGKNEPEAEAGKSSSWSPRTRTARYEYRLINPSSEPITQIDVYVPLPVDSPRQEIHYLQLPEEPSHRIITDRHGQRLAHYVLEHLEPGQWIDLGYVVGITLQNMQWNTPDERAEEPVVLTPEQRELYLRPESNYSMDAALMRETAASLADGATTDFEKLERIHDHVIGAIRYVRDDQWDPAATVLARGTGSCSEYNYVLSGLCRLAGLPTRCAGGTTNGFRDLPTTDTVFHRWTEVFPSGYGWFPVDCSRDANPIRGKRSHFGRVYTDAMVWCHQAGGRDDTLGWDYRAHARVAEENSGIRGNHRVRWFRFYQEDKVDAARAWFREGKDTAPEPDLLECALLDWHRATDEGRLRIIDSLAKAGRTEALRRSALLPLTNQVREDRFRQLCRSPELADAFLKESHDLWALRNWLKSRESKLSAVGDGQFELTERRAGNETSTTVSSASEIWTRLANEAADRLAKTATESENRPIAIMPAVDQTTVGLGKRRDSILSTLKERISEQTQFQLLDDARFDLWMQDEGPGSGEYWLLANGSHEPPEQMSPDVVVVPVCAVSREKDSVLYRLDLKVLELGTCKYDTISNRVRRVAKSEPPDCGLLVAGGDTVLARWEHDLVGRRGYDWPLAGVADVLTSADVALCNLECCVSLQGTPAEKGERCPFYYRARPEMLRCLTRAGIDVVTAANNHGGDYGPVSVADTARWCEAAGLACAGVGMDRNSAEEPRIVQVGPVRIAVAGMDATMLHFAAGDELPGTSFAPEDESLKAFTEKVRRLGQWAEGRCDLLVLTIHWGPNWDKVPTPARKAMARIAFEHGVDLILGHSAHRFQGVEIVDGKPVLYDMGNLLFDCEMRDEGRRSALFRLRISPKGVHKIEIIPIEALLGHTVLAETAEARAILAEMGDLCSELGTELSIDEDLEGRPMGVIDIPNPKATRRERPASTPAPSLAPVDEMEIPDSFDETLLVDKLPDDAQILTPPATLAPGVELLGYSLPDTAIEGRILEITTWWRVTGPVDRNIMPAFHLRPKGETLRRGTPWYTRHDAGDWTVPLHRLKPGIVVKDRYPCRLADLPPGPLMVYSLVIDTSRPDEDRIL